MPKTSPLRPRRLAPGSPRRGSALIIVVLVVLVLTVVGLGIAFFASTEDRTSGNVRMSRVGFYAAEAGLRQAEALVTNFATTGGDVSTLLSGSGSDIYNPPGGGRPAFLLKFGSTSYRNVVLTQNLGDPSTRAMYSLFIRNNQDDLRGTDNVDNDRKINIIAVGQMVLVDGSGDVIVDGAGNPTIGITKVLEEQIETNPEGSAAATQKGANTGGTSSGAY